MEFLILENEGHSTNHIIFWWFFWSKVNQVVVILCLFDGRKVIENQNYLFYILSNLNRVKNPLRQCCSEESLTWLRPFSDFEFIWVELGSLVSESALDKHQGSAPQCPQVSNTYSYGNRGALLNDVTQSKPSQTKNNKARG